MWRPVLVVAAGAHGATFQSDLHHAPGARARRRLDSGDLVPAAGAELYEGMSTHYTHLFVGTPPQRVSVIVDTGSHHAAWVCDSCYGCGNHADQPFSPGKSSSYEALAGVISQSYEEGSMWHADRARDVVSLGNVDGTVRGWDSADGGGLYGGETTPILDKADLPEVELTFGCIDHQTRLFVTQTANGIIGMSPSPESFIEQAYAEGVIDEKIFSLCFTPADPKSQSQSFAGFFVLGGSDTSQHVEPMEYIKLDYTTGGFYGVETLGVSLSADDVYSSYSATPIAVSNSVYNQGKGMIVDSGTTDIYLPSGCAAAFKEAWRQYVPHWAYDVDGLIGLTPQELQALPHIHVRIRGVDGGEVVVSIPAVSYFEKEDADCGFEGESCDYFPRIFLDEPRGGVLGGPFFAGHDIQFDLERRTLGIAKATCEMAMADGKCDDTCEFANDGDCNDFVAYDDEYYYDGYFQCDAGTDCTDCCVENNCTAPTPSPTRSPTLPPTVLPSTSPSPTRVPRPRPTRLPTLPPSACPSQTPAPTRPPVFYPTRSPTKSSPPTRHPTWWPSFKPTRKPTDYVPHALKSTDDDDATANAYDALKSKKTQTALLALGGAFAGLVLFFCVFFCCRPDDENESYAPETEMVDRAASPARRKQKYTRAPGPASKIDPSVFCSRPRAGTAVSPKNILFRGKESAPPSSYRRVERTEGDADDVEGSGGEVRNALRADEEDGNMILAAPPSALDDSDEEEGAL